MSERTECVYEGGWCVSHSLSYHDREEESMKYAVVKATDEIEFHEVNDPNLINFQEHVKGYIQALVVRYSNLPPITMYINEEGKLIGLARNPIADGFMRGNLLPGDFIVGNAVLIGPPDRDGNDTELPPEWVKYLETLND